MKKASCLLCYGENNPHVTLKERKRQPQDISIKLGLIKLAPKVMMRRNVSIIQLQSSFPECECTCECKTLEWSAKGSSQREASVSPGRGAEAGDELNWSSMPGVSVEAVARLCPHGALKRTFHVKTYDIEGQSGLFS